MVKKYEALVIGGGPAGASSALALARRGVSVAVIDKATFPRPKCCAGGVPARTARLLPFDISEAAEQPVCVLEVTREFGERVVYRGEQPFVYAVSRETFDARLLAAAREAGAVVIEGAKFLGLSLSEPITVHTTVGDFEAGTVIGADGAPSRVARCAGLLSRHPQGMAVQCEVPDEPDGTIKMDWGTVPMSYAWAFPARGGWSVGCGGFAGFERLFRAYRRRFAASCGLTPHPEQVRGHMLPQRLPHEPIRRGRVLLVGDAAGLMDGFTGEGIHYAIESGRLAAESIRDPDGYEAAVRRELVPELDDSRRLALFVDCFPAFCHRMLCRNQAGWEMMIATLAGTATYSEIRRKLAPETVWRLLPKIAKPLRARRLARFERISPEHFSQR
ncbi:MAG: geranylgeranyl reductase family protein [Armatimonadota bacterium]